MALAKFQPEEIIAMRTTNIHKLKTVARNNPFMNQKKFNFYGIKDKPATHKKDWLTTPFPLKSKVTKTPKFEAKPGKMNIRKVR